MSQKHELAMAQELACRVAFMKHKLPEFFRPRGIKRTASAALCFPMPVCKTVAQVSVYAVTALMQMVPCDIKLYNAVMTKESSPLQCLSYPVIVVKDLGFCTGTQT